MRSRGGQLQNKVKAEWSANIAYAIGLIASDGCLHKNGKHIRFVSKDLELVNNFKIALGVDNKIGKSARGGEVEKKYFYTGFGDKIFYNFLQSIGLTPAKSRTIKKVDVPVEYFPDFLRGLFEGDGTFFTTWDNRWPNSFAYKISFCSASADFMDWLKSKLTELYKVKGVFHKGAGVQRIEYVKGDTRKLFEIMYHSADILLLNRKYSKIKNAFHFDSSLKIRSKFYTSFRLVKIMPR